MTRTSRTASGPRRPGGRRAVVVALCIGLLAGAAAPAASQEPETETIWQEFEADRADLYNTLAPPFVECFKRRDSLVDPASPIFHGCIDWHSAVHAAYSHHALYHRTGAYAYLDLAEQQIAPAGVSLIPAEYRYQQAKGLDLPLTENPYGFGWFLVLARERELSTGKDDFREMADYAASAMASWFETRLENRDAQSFILNAAHANYSWSLINLDLWARYTEDQELQAAVRDFSTPLFHPSLDGRCPAAKDALENAGGFQPTCLMRLAAAAHVWGDHVSGWVAERLPEAFHVPPITDPGGCHQGGLNFSRSFALYQLFLATGDTGLRDNYVELIRYHVGRPDLYSGGDYLGDPGYLCYSHWVAQFGVRSISLSFEERPAAPDAVPPV